MSFVVEGKEALYQEDIIEVLGPNRKEEAEEAFAALDGDGNGDISLDEMIMKIVEMGRDRKAISSSMKDVGQAIGVLDQIFCGVIFIITIFIFGKCFFLYGGKPQKPRGSRHSSSVLYFGKRGRTASTAVAPEGQRSVVSQQSRDDLLYSASFS